MRKPRLQLKITSVIILAFAFLTFVRIVLNLAFGEVNTPLMPQDTPENVLLITKIFVVTVSFIMILPQIYLGVKGIWAANHRRSSRLHIIVAVILFVLSCVSLASPVASIVKKDDIFINLLVIAGLAIQIIVYFEYAKHSREVAKSR